MAVGTWRPFLDEVVLKGAYAYALRMLSIKADHQARVDLASARTELGLTTAVHVLVNTALNAVATAGGVAVTAITAVAAFITAGGTALDGVATQVTALTTASTGVLALAIAELAKANADLLTGAEGVWTDEVKYISGSTGIIGAQPYLETGDGKIDTVNIGDRAAEMYHLYAGREVEIAALWDAKRKDFLTEAARHIDTMNGYFTEAVQRLGIASRVIEEAGGETNLALAKVREAEASLGVCQARSQEAQFRIAEIQSHISEAETFIASATMEFQASDKYYMKYKDEMGEFKEVLKDRAQYRTNITSVSLKQPR